jgi:hypothetical protein
MYTAIDSATGTSPVTIVVVAATPAYEINGSTITNVYLSILRADQEQVPASPAIKRPVFPKTGDYTVAAATDNRAVIEVTGTYTVTLPDASDTIDASLSGDFRVTVHNAGTGTVTVTCADNINGEADDITMDANQSLTVQINNAQDGYSVLSSTVPLAVTNYIARKNLIINGCFRVNQRGDQTAMVSGEFALDRFEWWTNTAATIDIAQIDLDVVSTTGLLVARKGSALQATGNNAASTLSNEYAGIETRLEGYDINHLMWGTDAGVSVTVTCYVTTSLAGWYSFSVRNGASTTSYIHEQELVADTRTLISFTIPKPPTSAGAWAADNTAGLKLWFDLGSDEPLTGTYSAPPDAWQASDSIVSDAQTPANWIGTAGQTYLLEDVQLEVGATATPFEHRPYIQERLLCHRYYEVTDFTLHGSHAGASTSYTTHQYKVPMRVAPEITVGPGTIMDAVRTNGTMGFGASRGSSGYVKIYPPTTFDAEL